MTVHINCEMCKTFKKDFFVNGTLTYTLRDHIYEHLFTCKECYAKYKQFAEENKYKFNLRESAIDFVLNNQNRKNCMTRDCLKELGFEKDIEARSKKWTLVAERFEMIKLNQLPAFKDFIQEKFEVNNDTFENDVYAVNEWTKHFARKVCKQIDHLEACYSISQDGDKKENEET